MARGDRHARSRPARLLRRWLVRTAGGGVALLLVLLNVQCAAPLRVPPLSAAGRPLIVDADLEIARRYAPFVCHAIDGDRGRQDLPTRVDFDGDLRGDNNWENLPHYELPPTLSYSLLTTETHLFLTYHLFHPRDWAPLDLGVHLTHENDGENLAVVVERASGAVVLLFTQAHYCGGVYVVPAREGEAVPERARFAAGREPLRGPLLLVDDEGRPDPHGRHPVVFVEDEGHGIYGITDAASGAAVLVDGSVRFADAGLVFRPAREGEVVREPPLPGEVGTGSERGSAASPAAHGAAIGTADFVPYGLESITAKLWPGVADGSLLGTGGLFDGGLRFRSPQIQIDVPRYYEGNRFSGPFGPDRGIAPFAVDFRFGAGEVGALFFDPARRYAECLGVPQPWSLVYEDYPFSAAR